MNHQKTKISKHSQIVQQPVAQLSHVPSGYSKFLKELKAQIKSAQIKAVLSVNRALILLYWKIGRSILDRQKKFGWGSKIVDRLAADLRRAFPDTKGFSPRNLKYMRTFAEAWPKKPFVQQLVAQIPWGHNVRLLEYVKNPSEREWYIRQTIQHGWSRDILIHQIESGLYKRQGKAITNFTKTLPSIQSDLAQQILKDPYHFDFLALSKPSQERELEKALLQNLRDFLLELGVGFSFVGSQFQLEVGDEDFYLDLLFYHLRLRCFVAIELKLGKFQPEYAGKMNFYLSALDEQLCQPADNPSIGIILCKSHNKVVAEYALRNSRTPMSVSTYRLTQSLPKNLQGTLPSIQELEAKLH